MFFSANRFSLQSASPENRFISFNNLKTLGNTFKPLNSLVSFCLLLKNISECMITMRKKFTFSSRADVYFWAFTVNCLKRKCRITLVHLKFKFVPKKEKKNQKSLIQKFYISIPKNKSTNECFDVIC